MEPKPQLVLSICIPTYNRAQYLRQCLDHITCQFEDPEVRDAIEIIISDNASTDSTPELMGQYTRQYPQITYVRQPENLGPDENAIRSILASNGKYFWNIGDDDFIQNGSLSYLLTTLAQKEVSLLSVNFQPLINTLQSLKKTDFNQKVIYETSAQKFYDKGYYQGILGIAIANRREWEKIDRANLELYWYYYEIILKMIGITSLPLAYVREPAIYIGQDYRWNSGGSALAIRIHCKRMLVKLANYNYTPSFIHREIGILARSLPRTVMSAKSFGLNFSWSHVKAIWQEFKGFPFILLVTSFIFCIPNGLLVALKKYSHAYRIL
ncbi:MAG: glycosyltransferase family 2 protein [Candidatus Staskawiczbacteria bacterium]|nr:glycosyltransferase family 2 protein [Candidatus Staskawiczbacteria bacterium]